MKAGDLDLCSVHIKTLAYLKVDLLWLTCERPYLNVYVVLFVMDCRRSL